MFVGYPTGQKWYKVNDTDTKEIHVSGDVIFLEDEFPFKKAKFEEVAANGQGSQITHWDIEAAATDDRPHDQEEGNEDGSITEIQEESTDNIQTQAEVQNERRHSERARLVPGHLKDYEVVLPLSIAQPSSNPPSGYSVIYPLENYISYNRFSNTYSVFLAAINSHDEPKHFSQAVKHAHRPERGNANRN